MPSQDFAIFAVKTIFTLAAIFLIVFFVLLPIFRSLAAKPDFLEQFDRYEVSANLEEEELELPGEDAKPGRDAILEQARADPHKTTRAVTAWLKEKK